MGGTQSETDGAARIGRIGLNEYPHDLSHVADKTVKCFLCGHAVPLESAFSAGPEIALSLYMHEECARKTPITEIRSRYHRSLKGMFLG